MNMNFGIREENAALLDQVRDMIQNDIMDAVRRRQVARTELRKYIQQKV